VTAPEQLAELRGMPFEGKWSTAGPIRFAGRVGDGLAFGEADT